MDYNELEWIPAVEKEEDLSSSANINSACLVRNLELGDNEIKGLLYVHIKEEKGWQRVLVATLDNYFK